MTLQDALAQSLKAMLGHRTTELHFIGQNLLLSQQTEGDDRSIAVLKSPLSTFYSYK